MITLEPVDARYDIAFGYGDRPTEFEVQSYLFERLKGAGVLIRGEVRWKHPSKREQCRFDLVIYSGGKPSHIIEVKDRPTRHKTTVEDTRQGRRYRLYGLPVTFVYGYEDADKFIESLLWSDE